jgi:hypothetical protein
MRVPQGSKGASRVALGGVLAALSLLLLFLAALLPTGRMAMVAVAGLVPAAGVVSGGLATGFLCYGATGILGLLLLPDKGCALLYALFFGLYPMVKSAVERLRKLPLELLLKLAFFNAALTVLFFGFSALMLPLLPDRLQGTLAVYLAGNVAFLLYDYGFSKLITYYAARLRGAKTRRG